MPEKTNASALPADGEIVNTRVFAASRERVFAAFADPAVLAQWWGPKGFTNEFHEFDFRAGGAWRFTMRGPDGTSYAMDKRFAAIEPPEQIVLRHAQAGHDFTLTMTLTARDAGTEVMWRMRFDDPAEGARLRDFITAANEENFDRLAAQLSLRPKPDRLCPMSTTALPASADSTADREIVLTRVFHAPRTLVWEAWTKPEHVVKWWGPRGFTTETKRHEFRVGGAWEHVMIGPDGTRFPNKSIFKEIVPQERVVYSHGGGREDGESPGANFTATWTFEALEGEKTRVTGRMIFPTAAARDHVVREYGAIEGGRQTLERLGEQLAAMQSTPFIISREFAAPRDLVWQVWTEGEHFARWFGPKGVKVTLVQFDPRPGGMNHYYMTLPDGKKMWGKAVYREIVPPTKLVWINSFSDEHAGLTRHPLTKDRWPLQLLTTVTFAENAGKTTVTVHWLPLDADDDERRVFETNRPSMNGGWGGTFDQLTAYLAEISKPS